MNSTSHELQSLLRRMVDESAKVHCISGEIPLSPYLSGSFDLHQGNVLGSSVLFAESRTDKDDALKRLSALEKAVGEPVVIYLPFADASQKRSLMAARQGFVTGQGDMYLPQLAVSLKAAALRKSSLSRSFTPAQQQAFLYCLLEEAPLTQEGLRKKTGISAAGASRALSSLSEAGLIDYEVGGKTRRKREYFVPDRRELFRKGKKLFGDPVKSIERDIRPLDNQFAISGLSALALRSDLVPPRNEVIAIAPHASMMEPFSKDAPIEGNMVQRLSYDPMPFAVDGVVDPFTMLVSIDEEDERISIALREALKEYAWYTD